MLDPALVGAKVLADSSAAEVQRYNRRWLQQALPHVIRTMPEGSGVLLDGGRMTPAADRLIPETDAKLSIDPTAVPWSAWWPVLRLWGGLLLMMAGASFGLMLLIYPQWAKNELLTFPIARLVAEVTEGIDKQSLLPALAWQKGFWLAAGGIAALHFWNGLAVWYNLLPAIPLKFDFTALGNLMPVTAQQYGFKHFFAPTLIPTVIAFAYFIEARVSLSVGLSVVFWLILGTLLTGQGIALSTNRFDVGPIGPALRYGAYIGMTLTILYLARSHLLRVGKLAIGLGGRANDARPVPMSCVAGLWLAVVCTMASIIWLVWWTPANPLVASALVLMVLMMWLVLARINAETGLFAISPEWIPWVMLASLIGPAAIGMESLIILAFGGLVLAARPRAALAPLLINALHIGHRVGGIRLSRLSGWLGFMVIASFLVALVVTLAVQYSIGLDTSSSHYRVMPGVSLGSFTRVLTEQAAVGMLAETTRPGFFQQLNFLEPNLNVLGWVTTGAVLVGLCLVARLRLTWWPLHPVFLLILGTYFSVFLAASFLLAWLIKSRVIALGGQRAYEAVKPWMVGLIVGELGMVVFWGLVNLVYRLNTGLEIETYQVIPI
jgi:hypothetical protein